MGANGSRECTMCSENGIKVDRHIRNSFKKLLWGHTPEIEVLKEMWRHYDPDYQDRINWDQFDPLTRTIAQCVFLHFEKRGKRLGLKKQGRKIASNTIRDWWETAPKSESGELLQSDWLSYYENIDFLKQVGFICLQPRPRDLKLFWEQAILRQLRYTSSSSSSSTSSSSSSSSSPSSSTSFSISPSSSSLPSSFPSSLSLHNSNHAAQMTRDTFTRMVKRIGSVTDSYISSSDLKEMWSEARKLNIFNGNSKKGARSRRDANSDGGDGNNGSTEKVNKHAWLFTACKAKWLAVLGVRHDLDVSIDVASLWWKFDTKKRKRLAFPAFVSLQKEVCKQFDFTASTRLCEALWMICNSYDGYLGEIKYEDEDESLVAEEIAYEDWARFAGDRAILSFLAALHHRFLTFELVGELWDTFFIAKLLAGRRAHKTRRARTERKTKQAFDDDDDDDDDSGDDGNNDGEKTVKIDMAQINSEVLSHDSLVDFFNFIITGHTGAPLPPLLGRKGGLWWKIIAHTIAPNQQGEMGKGEIVNYYRFYLKAPVLSLKQRMSIARKNRHQRERMDVINANAERERMRQLEEEAERYADSVLSLQREQLRQRAMDKSAAEEQERKENWKRMMAEKEAFMRQRQNDDFQVLLELERQQEASDMQHEIEGMKESVKEAQRRKARMAQERIKAEEEWLLRIQHDRVAEKDVRRRQHRKEMEELERLQREHTQSQEEADAQWEKKMEELRALEETENTERDRKKQEMMREKHTSEQELRQKQEEIETRKREREALYQEQLRAHREGIKQRRSKQEAEHKAWQTKLQDQADALEKKLKVQYEQEDLDLQAQREREEEEKRLNEAARIKREEEKRLELKELELMRRQKQREQKILEEKEALLRNQQLEGELMEKERVLQTQREELEKRGKEQEERLRREEEEVMSARSKLEQELKEEEQRLLNRRLELENLERERTLKLKEEEEELKHLKEMNSIKEQQVNMRLKERELLDREREIERLKREGEEAKHAKELQRLKDEEHKKELEAEVAVSKVNIKQDVRRRKSLIQAQNMPKDMQNRFMFTEAMRLASIEESEERSEIISEFDLFRSQVFQVQPEEAGVVPLFHKRPNRRLSITVGNTGRYIPDTKDHIDEAVAAVINSQSRKFLVFQILPKREIEIRIYRQSHKRIYSFQHSSGTGWKHIVRYKVTVRQVLDLLLARAEGDDNFYPLEDCLKKW